MIKECKDYVDEVQQLFPELTKQQVSYILRYGMNKYLSLNKNGFDIQIRKNKKDQSYFIYTGNLVNDPLRKVKYSQIKKSDKDCYKAIIKGEVYDGYYYFGANRYKYNEIMRSMNNKSFKYIHFENITFTTIEKELYHKKFFDYIFRMKFPIFLGIRFKKKKYKYDKTLIELVSEKKDGVWHKNQQTRSLED